jgi:O-antigen/teichoic acid export membrane protein
LRKFYTLNPAIASAGTAGFKSTSADSWYHPIMIPVREPAAAGGARPISLRRNFTWTFAGNVVLSASNWLLLVVLAKLVPLETVGRYTLAQAYVIPVFTFALLGLRSVQATDARREFTFGDYHGLRLLGMIAGLAVCGGIALFRREQDGIFTLTLLLATVKTIEGGVDLIYGALQGQERMDAIARSQMTRGLLGLALWTAALALFRDVRWGVAGLACATLVSLAGVDFPNLRRFVPGGPGGPGGSGARRPRFDAGTLQRLFWLALPLGLLWLLTSLYWNAPRYVIESVGGPRALGIFGAIGSLISAGQTLVSALGQSASPRLAQYFAAGRTAEFRRLMIKMLGIGTAVGLAGIGASALLGREILTFMFRPEYAEGAPALVAMMVTGLFTYLSGFLGVGITAMRNFRVQVWANLLSVSTAAALSLALVPRFGLPGAAWALAASQLLLSTAYAALMIQLLRKGSPP